FLYAAAMGADAGACGRGRHADLALDRGPGAEARGVRSRRPCAGAGRGAAAGAEAALSRLSANSDEASAGLRETVALLFEARLAEMAREGRREEMETLLAAITGPERAAAIAGRVRTRQYG
ncbi:MAG: hypothetical protein OXE57_03375, partial [Alphaproteobacteria bacterium]|nr:hypothetical protein [Alphaproteobacteria bacterium]